MVATDSMYDSFIATIKKIDIDVIKMFIACIVVTLLLIVVAIGIGNRFCILQLHPAINFIILFFALTLLAYVEALHYACVAVEKWDMAAYRDKYPRAVKCQALVDTPEKVKKFLVGRQFFVIFVVFLIAEITSFPYMPTNFAGLPPLLLTILIKTGLPGVALVLTFGQLVSQIFVEEYTVQFLNFYGCEFCIRLALFAEYIGICHFSWLLYHVSSYFACGKVMKVQRSLDDGSLTSEDFEVEVGRPDMEGGQSGAKFAATSTISTSDIKSSDAILDKDILSINVKNDNNSRNNPNLMSPTALNRGPNFDSGIPNISCHSFFELLKYLWSSFATIGSLAIVIYGISKQAYTLPVGVAGAFIIACCDLVLLFYLEGLMIAVVGTQYWNKETWRTVYPRAYKLHDVLNKPDNVKRFIIGRQFFTVLTGFLLAQVFSFPGLENTNIDETLFYICVKSGLPGVLVVLAFGQLLPELTAAEYPLRFMNLRGSYTVGYVSLIFDKFAVGHCAWATYYLIKSTCLKGMTSSEGDKAHEGQPAKNHEKPEIMTILSAEILAGSPRKNGGSSVEGKYGSINGKAGTPNTTYGKL